MPSSEALEITSIVGKGRPMNNEKTVEELIDVSTLKLCTWWISEYRQTCNQRAVVNKGYNEGLVIRCQGCGCQIWRRTPELAAADWNATHGRATELESWRRQCIEARDERDVYEKEGMELAGQLRMIREVVPKELLASCEDGLVEAVEKLAKWCGRMHAAWFETKSSGGLEFEINEVVNEYDDAIEVKT